MISYTKSHEWVDDLGNNVVRIGMSDYAQSQLGDIVFINLPEVGEQLMVGKPFADVESVKAVSEIYSPVSGVVSAVNEELLDHPEHINENALVAWLIEVEGVSALSDTMDELAYLEFVK